MPSDVKTDDRNDDLQVDLHGRTAIVTGSATGIGSAIARRLARSGANVVVDYRSETNRAKAEQVRDAVTSARGRCAIVRADVTQESDVDALVESARRTFGALHLLVNNAGIEEAHLVVDTPLDVWERILRVNLTGSFLCARAAARAMIAAGRGGRIVNISSVHEDLPMPKNAAYCASKGGLRTFARTLALELAPHRITVNNVAPGAIATRINRDVRQDPDDRKELLEEIPLGRVGDAAEVAALVAYLASDAAAYVTGATYLIDGGLSRYTKGL